MPDPMLGRSICPIHPRLTFDEANIVHMNIMADNSSKPVPLAEFQYRLENLLRHTPDSCLSASIRSLQKKIRHLSQAEYDQLCADFSAQKILSTENYPLPNL